MAEDNLINEISDYISLPMIPLRGIVAFPNIQLNVEIVRQVSLKAFTAAATVYDAKVILVTQGDIGQDNPTVDDFFQYGVLAEIKHVVKNASGNLTVLFEGISRVKLENIEVTNGYFTATADIIPERQSKKYTTEMTATVAEIKNDLIAIADMHPSFSEDVRMAADAITDYGYFADFVASSALIDYRNKQRVLESLRLSSRLENLYLALEEEMVLIECEHEIQARVRNKVDQNQRDFYLREQMRVIQSELGEDDDEIAEYERKIEEADLPDEVREKLYKELSKLSKTPFGAAEGAVLRSYIDTCLEFPFGKKSTDETSVSEARIILDEDHYGLEKVKERILEFVAVKHFTSEVKSQILCLVGKTSVAASIARALHKEYARVSLGGMHDEAELRGHRKTYVAAMPGRIITALIGAKVLNPVIVLDEIDKMAKDFRGDPTSALLEILDPEQNKSFRDNFMELPIDLSDTLFIATANNYEDIPAPLLDRMEIIELSTYTDTEKLNIAKRHLIPKQLKKTGLNSRMFKIKDDAIVALIKGYTREAGVRNLERELASLMRKVAKNIAEGKYKSATITTKNLESYLGKTRVIPEAIEDVNPIGVANGLAYTMAGGDLLKVEVAVMSGTGKIELTGSLGDVMKESAKIAHSYVRTIADEFSIDKDFYKNLDLHIHFPEGAVPKDGPSAGVTMVSAIVSALTGRPTLRDVAMTGEVTLRGRVLPIGGLKEKTLAAYRAGVKTVLIPRANLRDLDEIDKEARDNLTFIPCDYATDVLSRVLT